VATDGSPARPSKKEKKTTTHIFHTMNLHPYSLMGRLSIQSNGNQCGNGHGDTLITAVKHFYGKNTSLNRLGVAVVNEVGHPIDVSLLGVSFALKITYV